MADITIQTASEVGYPRFRIVSPRFQADLQDDELVNCTERQAYLEASSYITTYWHKCRRTQCINCGGSGKRFLFTSEEDCVTCLGAGVYYEST